MKVAYTPLRRSDSHQYTLGLLIEFYPAIGNNAPLQSLIISVLLRYYGLIYDPIDWDSCISIKDEQG